MKLRERRHFRKPELVIIPMIDIMFFLLVFFMLSTLYMVDLRTIQVRLLTASHAAAAASVAFVVTMKEDGALWLEDQRVEENQLVKLVAEAAKKDTNFSLVLRANQVADYGKVIALLDRLKGVGVQRFGLATAQEVKSK